MSEAGEYYAPAYFAGQGGGSYESARRIVPIVMEALAPQSVVDVGCGVGAWLRAFAEQGVRRVLGIDGDYVERSMLQIDPGDYLGWDLAKPLAVDERFDLALSLEVACDLEPAQAPRFVEDLVRLAPAVLFSSAIPHQGGFHVNEQWQSYWAALFERHGYLAIDVIRPAVWNDAQVEWWYAQNALLYVTEDVLAAKLPGASAERSPARLDVIAPRYYLYQREVLGAPGVQRAVRMLAAATARETPRLYERLRGRIARARGPAR